MTRKATRHAPFGGSEPIRDGDLIEGIAERVVTMGMATPAIALLARNEPHAPARVDAMAVLGPIAATYFPCEGYDRFQRLFARRENVDLLLRAIERREAEVEMPCVDRRRITPERRFAKRDRRCHGGTKRTVTDPDRLRRSPSEGDR
ncbi:MAG: hypothetical protein JW958_10070 [Candidatus Eisenbacteria bacterium]|nr:hypothetical protein [Candidatus Eisenbacteria bacterium]